MSSNQGYQQSEAMAQRLDDKLESMADKPAGTIRAPEGGQSRPQASAVGVPGYYHTQDSAADTRMAWRSAAAGYPVDPNNPIFSGLDRSEVAALQNFKVDLTQKDIDFFEKRRAEQLQVEFDDWLVGAVDISDPGEARWLQQMYPEFWARREKFLDDKINVEARASKIRLRGIKDKEDLKFLFAIAKGYIRLPTEPAFTGTPTGAGYQKGWFRRKGTPIAFSSNKPDSPFPAAFRPLGAGAGQRDVLAGFR